MVNRPRSFEELWAKLETVSAESPLWHRLYRSLSWLERAAAEDDLDAKCVFLWVAFNAAYAIERRAEIDESGYEVYEHQRRERYFTILTRCGSPCLHGRVRTKLSDPIARLMSNEYVYKGFWDSLTDEPFDWENWRNKRRFERERDEVRRELRAPKGTNTLGMLLTVFERLYVLRNQLMHGCATQNGSLNRRQVKDGAQILGVLVPVFLDIMMEHDDEDWGKISYPVRPDIREDRPERL